MRRRFTGWRSGPQQRFFFVHLLKTAGTSLRQQLMRQFPGPALYPNPNDGDPVRDAPQLAIDPLIATWSDPRRRRRLQLIIGHYPLATVDLLEGDFEVMTVLRDPVDRTLSYLRHYRLRNPEWSQLPMTQVYDDPFVHRTMIRNHMTKMLGMTGSEMSAGMLTDVVVAEPHLDRARQALDAMAAVGLVEQLPQFLGQLEQRFGWDLGDPVRVNDTVVDERVAPDFIDRIRADNALDLALYEHARQCVQSSAH